MLVYEYMDGGSLYHQLHEVTMIYRMLCNIGAAKKCDRIWENPAYHENAQAAQCALLVPQVKKYQSSFCHIHVKEPFY